MDDRATLSAKVFSEPLTDETHKRKRALLLAAALAILVSAFELRAKLPWLDLDTSSSPVVLQGTLSIALLYLMLAFWWNVWEDLRRWHTAATLLHLDRYSDKLSSANHHAEQAVRNLGSPAAEKIQADTLAFCASLEEFVDETRQSHQRLSRLQLGKLVVMEAGGPTMLALFAFYKSHDAFFPFLSAVF